MPARPARSEHSFHVGGVALPSELDGGAPAHLRRRRHAARGDEDEERDVPGPRRRERRHPSALAEAPEADPLRVDLRARCERRYGGERIGALLVETIGRAGPPVEPKYGDAPRRQHAREVEEEEVIARRTAGRMQGDDRRSGAADAGEMQLAGQPREAQLLPPHRLPRRAHLSATAAESR